MNKDIFKIIGLIVALVALVGVILFILIKGVTLGDVNVVSVMGIGEKRDAIETANTNLNLAQTQYESTMKNLETEKKDFNSQKEAYELISDEKIAAVKEATKQEEYMIEYLWITLGNYATAHNLSIAVIEPGGTLSGNMNNATGGSTANQNAGGTTTSPISDASDVDSVGGIEGIDGMDSLPTTPTTPEENEEITPGDLTVQVTGTYMDLADFVFEVENDKSLRFRLDNIKMTSSGGTEVTTTFNVKDFTVLKYLR